MADEVAANGRVNRNSRRRANGRKTLVGDFKHTCGLLLFSIFLVTVTFTRLYNADATVNWNLEIFLGVLCVPVMMALMWDRHDTEVISRLRGKWWYLAFSLIILFLLLVLLVGVTLIGLGYFWTVLISPAQNKDTAVFKIENANNPALEECADEVSAADPENYCNIKEGEMINLESGERSFLVKQDGQTVRYVYHMEGPKIGQVNYMEYKFYSKDGRPEARYISALELTDMQNVK